jgi:hypothetical protein
MRGRYWHSSGDADCPRAVVAGQEDAMAATNQAVEIARRSQEMVNGAVRRWTDAVQSSADSRSSDAAGPVDPRFFLDEFFDFFERVLSDEREVAQQRLAAAENTASTTPEQGPGATELANRLDRDIPGDSGESDGAVTDDDTADPTGARGAHFWQVAGVEPPNAADDRVPESAALAELAGAFTALVRALADEDNVTTVAPRRIIQLAVDCMPRVQHAAVITMQDGEARTIAATSGLPDRIDRIRSATGQGPGIDVLEANELVVSNDLTEDRRWPLFAGRLVDELAVRSIVSYRLYLGPHDRAALSFYSDWPDAFDNLAITTGAIFAAYCSLAMFSRLPHRSSGSQDEQ